MQFRHEVKHEISNHDMLILRQRLRAVMKPDSHAVNGRYEIRSLYFDNLDDKALRETMTRPLSIWNESSNTAVLATRTLRGLRQNRHRR